MANIGRGSDEMAVAFQPYSSDPDANPRDANTSSQACRLRSDCRRDIVRQRLDRYLRSGSGFGNREHSPKQRGGRQHLAALSARSGRERTSGNSGRFSMVIFEHRDCDREQHWSRHRNSTGVSDDNGAYGNDCRVQGYYGRSGHDHGDHSTADHSRVKS